MQFVLPQKCALVLRAGVFKFSVFFRRIQLFLCYLKRWYSEWGAKCARWQDVNLKNVLWLFGLLKKNWITLWKLYSLHTVLLFMRVESVSCKSLKMADAYNGLCFNIWFFCKLRKLFFFLQKDQEDMEEGCQVFPLKVCKISLDMN